MARRRSVRDADLAGQRPQAERREALLFDGLGGRVEQFLAEISVVVRQKGSSVNGSVDTIYIA